MLTLSSPLSAFFCRRPAPVVVDDAPPALVDIPAEPPTLTEAEALEWKLWDAKQQVMSHVGCRPTPGRPEAFPADQDWTPPDSRVLIFDVDACAAFSPKSPAALPCSVSTMLMPREPANTLAVMLNANEMKEGLRRLHWFAVVRPCHHSGFRVLRVTIPGDWQPASPLAFPPGTTDGETANVPAMQESKAFNRKIMAMGITTRHCVFPWAVAVRPLTAIG